MPDKHDSLIKMKAVLKAYPLIWFDSNTMAFLLDRDRKTVLRNSRKLAKEGMLETKGRYFKLLIQVES